MNLFSNFKRLRFIILDTLSDILDKCLCFSLIKIESVSIFQTKPCLVSSQSSRILLAFSMLVMKNVQINLYAAKY